MIRKHPFRELSLIMVAISVSGKLSGQSQMSNEGPQPFGKGETSNLTYAGEETPDNTLLIGLRGEAGYDDNVFVSNKHKVGDNFYLINPSFHLGESRSRVSIGLDYLPSAIAYQKISPRDFFDNGGRLDLTGQPSQNFSMRFRDSGHYSHGLTGAGSDLAVLSDLGAPTRLNESVLTPLANQFENTSRLDSTYQWSNRSAIDLSGNFDRRYFKHPVVPGVDLFNTTAWGSGLQYSYRLIPTFTLGPLYMLQNFKTGNTSRAIIHSAFFSFAWQTSPSVTFDAYGGPQYMRPHDYFLLVQHFLGGTITLKGASFAPQWTWGGGGDITKQTARTVIVLSISRKADEGGGLLPGVVSIVTGSLSVRRRLTQRWNATTDLEYGYERTEDLVSGKDWIQTGTSMVGIERSLTERLIARLEYSYRVQRRNNTLPFQVDVNGYRVSLGFDYHFRGIPLGR
jgi:hypothetical protein